MSPEIADQEAEADRLCELVAPRATDLASLRLGKSFRLGDAGFRLHVRSRNTIYRVRDRFDWFLKLAPPADSQVMPREQLGADLCRRILGGRPEFSGPLVSRVSLSPPYILATAVPGVPVTRALASAAWAPGSSSRTETTFATLGTLLGSLHAHAVLPHDAPEATKRPFEVVQRLSERIDSPDETVAQIRDWCRTRREGPEDITFVHGNLRLDNLLTADGRVGFVDFEACGSGPSHQDTSRPITQLLLLRASIAAPSRRVDLFLQAFLRAYGSVRQFDEATLGDWVAVRLARYYLESHGRRLPGLIGGLPVVRTRLGSVTRGLMREGPGNLRWSSPRF